MKKSSSSYFWVAISTQLKNLTFLSLSVRQLCYHLCHFNCPSQCLPYQVHYVLLVMLRPELHISQDVGVPGFYVLAK